jgi:succinate dehydrogenase / fumarate reductase cytochrome b subunit
VALRPPSDDKRPVFLNLAQIALPVTALVSILHRITGVILVLGLPLAVCVMRAVLLHPQDLTAFIFLPQGLLKFMEWGVVVSLMYHILAGMRHMGHDFTGCHSLAATRFTAVVVLSLWLLCMVVGVYKLWG